MKHSDLNSEFTAKFYDSRYSNKNSNSTNCGWGSAESQTLRFQQLFLDQPFKGKNIVDFGCGMGDLIPFLNSKSKNYNYLGVDISERLLEDAALKYNTNSHIQFCLGDLESCFKRITYNKPDIVVASGVFTLTRLGTDNLEFAQNFITQMFEISTTMVAVNFMSTQVDYINPKNFHFDPEQMLQFGKSLSEEVLIIENYGLWEFTLQICKGA